ncbi:MAG: hypothetical protein GPJ54_03930 [Candidatus Heimdallarchaeota archaeon]|nr:hypothetical protein [Candidatus Heimdallarchaeota archaeon]
MSSREDLEKLDINQLYNWVNKQYDNYTGGQITETEYLADLDFYKTKLALSNEDPKPPTSDVEVSDKQSKVTSPSQVRSTSIAGLRKKLLDELND